MSWLDAQPLWVVVLGGILLGLLLIAACVVFDVDPPDDDWDD